MMSVKLNIKEYFNKYSIFLCTMNKSNYKEALEISTSTNRILIDLDDTLKEISKLKPELYMKYVTKDMMIEYT